MSMVLTLILVVQMLSALAMIGLILIQHGKGADMGAAFGSGGSGSLFGATGGANFLSRTTAVLAAVFFVCTLLLAYFSNARPAAPSGLCSCATAKARACRVLKLCAKACRWAGSKSCNTSWCTCTTRGNNCANKFKPA